MFFIVLTFHNISPKLQIYSFLVCNGKLEKLGIIIFTKSLILVTVKLVTFLLVLIIPTPNKILSNSKVLISLELSHNSNDGLICQLLESFLL